MTRKREHSRLRQSGVATLKQFSTALIVSVFFTLAFVALRHYRQGYSRWDLLDSQTLSAFTAPFSVVFSFLSLFKDFGNKPRRVKILMASRSDFQSCVLNGFERAFAHDSKSIEWENITPASDNWNHSMQIEALRKLRSEKVDGLVILPTEMSDEILRELEFHARQGVFIIILENEVPKERFRSQGSLVPFVIKPDFRACGELLGNEIANFLESNAKSTAINVIGPIGGYASTQALDVLTELRTRLNEEGLLGRVEDIQLSNWNVDVAARKVIEAIESSSNRRKGDLLVFCGTDQILIRTWSLLFDAEFNSVRDRVRLIGLDGVRDHKNRFIVDICSNSLGTIDTEPTAMGMRAAELLLEEHTGVIDQLQKTIRIAPSLYKVGH